jgi:shikimate dehydrogenase
MHNLQVNSQTELYCIFGKTVRTSLSPVMHNAAFRATKRNAIYLAFQPDSIEHAIEAMRSLKIRGASVTMPFKEEVLRYIDEVDTLAENIASVNTLVNSAGRISGYNTDGYGALIALRNHIKSLDRSKVLILGNGGSARAIAFTLMMEGVHITIAGRDMDRVTPLLEHLKRHKSDIQSLLIKDISKEFIRNIDIIINTTPVGMAPNIDQLPIGVDLINSNHIIFDIVYSPPVTRLLHVAQEKGCRTIHGSEMLLYQGVKQFEIWTGDKAPVDIMRDNLEKNLHSSLS